MYEERTDLGLIVWPLLRSEREIPHQDFPAYQRKPVRKPIKFTSRKCLSIYLYFHSSLYKPSIHWFTAQAKEASFLAMRAAPRTPHITCPTNRSILFEMLTMTEACTSAQKAPSDVVQNRIQPFYASIGLPTKSINAMKSAAKALYHQHRRLITFKVSEKRPKDFDERCNSFAGNLDKVFNVAPASGLKDEHVKHFQALEVVIVHLCVCACARLLMCVFECMCVQRAAISSDSPDMNSEITMRKNKKREREREKEREKER